MPRISSVSVHPSDTFSEEPKVAALFHRELAERIKASLRTLTSSQLVKVGWHATADGESIERLVGRIETLMTSATPTVVGGKAANLALLREVVCGEVLNGVAISVPSFLSISDEQMRSYLLEQGVNPTQFDLSSEELAGLLATGEFIREELELFIGRLPSNSRLMVRSSGGEDEADFANQGGNLSVAGLPPQPGPLYQAMGEVLLSYFGERSQGQARLAGVDSERQERLSLLVQLMVAEEEDTPPPLAGVMYTEGTEVHYGWGYGGYVLGGHGPTSQSYLHEDPELSLDVLRSQPFRLQPMFNEGGVDMREVAQEVVPQLPIELKRSLFQLARRLEGLYTQPMDVEWVYDASKSELYVVQARPIVSAEARPSYLAQEAIESSPCIRGNTLSYADGAVRSLTDPDQLICCDNVASGLNQLLNRSNGAASVELVVSRSAATELSHEVTCLRSLNIPILILPDPKELVRRLEHGSTLQVDLQQGVVIEQASGVSLAPIQEGWVRSPIARVESVASNRISPAQLAHWRSFVLATPDESATWMEELRKVDQLVKQREPFVNDRLITLHAMILRIAARWLQCEERAEKDVLNERIRTLLSQEGRHDVIAAHSVQEELRLRNQKLEACEIFEVDPYSVSQNELAELILLLDTEAFAPQEWIKEVWRRFCCALSSEQRGELATTLRLIGRYQMQGLWLSSCFVSEVAEQGEELNAGAILAALQEEVSELSVFHPVWGPARSLIDEWRERVALWVNPNGFSSRWDRLESQLHKVDPLVALLKDEEMGLVARGITIGLLREVVTLLDHNIKTIRSSAFYREAKLELDQVKHVGELVGPLIHLMSELMILLPQEIFQEWYNNDLEFASTKEEMRKEIVEHFESLVGEPKREMLRPSPRFAVNAARIGSGASFKRSFTNLKDEITLENVWSLAHQNCLMLLAALDHSQEHLVESCSHSFISFAEALKTAFGGGNTLAMRHERGRSVIELNFPIRNHSSQISITLDRSSGKLSLAGQVVGHNALKRMVNIALLLRDFCETTGAEMFLHPSIQDATSESRLVSVEVPFGISSTLSLEFCLKALVLFRGILNISLIASRVQDGPFMKRLRDFFAFDFSSPEERHQAVLAFKAQYPHLFTDYYLEQLSSRERMLLCLDAEGVQLDGNESIPDLIRIWLEHAIEAVWNGESVLPPEQRQNRLSFCRAVAILKREEWLPHLAGSLRPLATSWLKANGIISPTAFLRYLIESGQTDLITPKVVTGAYLPQTEQREILPLLLQEGCYGLAYLSLANHWRVDLPDFTEIAADLLNLLASFEGGEKSFSWLLNETEVDGKAVLNQLFDRVAELPDLPLSWQRVVVNFPTRRAALLDQHQGKIAPVLREALDGIQNVEEQVVLQTSYAEVPQLAQFMIENWEEVHLLNLFDPASVRKLLILAAKAGSSRSLSMDHFVSFETASKQERVDMLLACAEQGDWNAALAIFSLSKRLRRFRDMPYLVNVDGFGQPRFTGEVVSDPSEDLSIGQVATADELDRLPVWNRQLKRTKFYAPLQLMGERDIVLYSVDGYIPAYRSPAEPSSLRVNVTQQVVEEWRDCRKFTLSPYESDDIDLGVSLDAISIAFASSRGCVRRLFTYLLEDGEYGERSAFAEWGEIFDESPEEGFRFVELLCKASWRSYDGLIKLLIQHRDLMEIFFVNGGGSSEGFFAYCWERQDHQLAGKFKEMFSGIWDRGILRGLRRSLRKSPPEWFDKYLGEELSSDNSSGEWNPRSLEFEGTAFSSSSSSSS